MPHFNDTLIWYGGVERRLAMKNPVRIDDQVVSDPSITVSIGSNPVKVSLGKKKHGLLTR